MQSLNTKSTKMLFRDPEGGVTGDFCYLGGVMATHRLLCLVRFGLTYCSQGARFLKIDLAQLSSQKGLTSEIVRTTLLQHF